MKILFLPGSFTSPSARFRVWQFVNPLKKLGHEVVVRVTTPSREYRGPLANNVMGRIYINAAIMSRLLSAFWALRDAEVFDVIFMNRDLVPEPKINFLEPWLAKKNPRLIFDFDDAIHLPPREKKLRRILPHFAWVTPGNEYLAEFARQVNHDVSILPTVVDTDYYHPVKERQPGPIRIGWSGSQANLQTHLQLIAKHVIALAERVEFEFIVIADVPPKLHLPGVKWRYIPWTTQTELEGLQQIDIGVMPLEDKPYERGKCGLKAIQYMGVGIPALVSPVGVNKDIVIHGENGFHCTDDEDWLFYLQLLLQDSKLRQQLGSAGRSHVEKNYSIKSQLPKIINIFEEVAGRNYRK